MKCIDCKFYVARKLDKFQRRYFTAAGVGFCHRYPTKKEKAGDSWCGEFKEKEKSIDSPPKN